MFCLQKNARAIFSNDVTLARTINRQTHRRTGEGNYNIKIIFPNFPINKNLSPNYKLNMTYITNVKNIKILILFQKWVEFCESKTTVFGN